jgi:hypothetical protein
MNIKVTVVHVPASTTTANEEPRQNSVILEPQQQRNLVQPWHNPTADIGLRKDIIREVVKRLLTFTQVRFIGDNRLILSESARQIEHALYRNMSTRAKYENLSTLEERMRPLVEIQFNRGQLQRPPSTTGTSDTNSVPVNNHTVPRLAPVNLDESTANSVHDTRNARPDHEILMYMLHAQRCTQTDQCNLIHWNGLDCKTLKRFVQHTLTCMNALKNECRCVKFRNMLAHFARCTNKESCSTCQLHYAVVVLKANFQREDEFQEKINIANGATVQDDTVQHEKKLGEFQQEIDKCCLARQGIVHHVYFDICHGDVPLARGFCLFSLEDLVSHPKNADRILEIDKMLTNSQVSFQREIQRKDEEHRSSIKRIKTDEKKHRSSTKRIKTDEKEQIVIKEPCGVCFETEFTEIGALDCCEHKFCYSCIEQWSKRCNNCPLCKRRFRLLKLLDSKTNLCKSTLMIRETILTAVPPR